MVELSPAVVVICQATLFTAMVWVPGTSCVVAPSATLAPSIESAGDWPRIFPHVAPGMQAAVGSWRVMSEALSFTPASTTRSTLVEPAASGRGEEHAAV